MKNYNKILEAINKGIKFALDDFDDQKEIQGQSNSKVKYQHGMKEYIDLMNEVVDLGFPSGTLWCKYNLGANNETQCGDFYAWGEIKTKSYYNWTNYKFTNEYIKYNNDDKLINIQPEDDVAYQNKKLYDFKFHIPSKEQFDELLQYTTNEYIDHKGWIFTSIINKNTIFFPTCGCIDGGSGKINKPDLICFLWSSTLSLSDYTAAYFLSLYGTFIKIREASKFVGMSIRPVLNL